jgi:FtsZ-interacting cell division protein YlmF
MNGDESSARRLVDFTAGAAAVWANRAAGVARAREARRRMAVGKGRIRD